MTISNANLSIASMDLQDLSPEVRDKLSLLMSRTYKGNNNVLLTPIAKENDPYYVLDLFDNIFNSKLSTMNKVLIDLELSNRDKFGPRSISKPWSQRVMSLISSYDRSENDNSAKLIVPPGLGRLRPISMQRAIDLLKNDTNSGLPYYDRKGIVKERVLRNFPDLIKRKDPCILFTRTQENNKTRNVWGFPIADTLNEMLYYKPLLEYQKTKSYRSALISPEEVSSSITSLILKARSIGNIIVSIDFSDYDTTVKSTLQMKAFEYIKSLFQDNGAPGLDYISERFKTIGILTPDGIFTGMHGVPSGSTFTNEVDSIVQRIISLNLPYVDNETCQIQGDDGVYSVQKEYVDSLFNDFEKYGLKVNREKSYSSSDYAIYLQNLYHIDYINNGIIGGIYPVYRALNRILFQERWSNFEDFSVTGKDYYSIRTITILENCKYHPLFVELVNFIYQLDKYSLDYSNQGLNNYIKMISKTEGLEGILNNQYGDNIKGINNFATVKVIKSLS